MRDSTVERYALAEQHRAPLRDIGKGYTPSDVIRITRYKAGQIVEIIERTVTQSRAVERVLFKQSAAKARAAARAERDSDEISREDSTAPEDALLINLPHGEGAA